MASVSLSLTVDQAFVVNDDDIVVGAAVPGAGDIELRVNMAQFTYNEQVMAAVEKFLRSIAHAKYGPTNFLEI